MGSSNKSKKKRKDKTSKKRKRKLSSSCSSSSSSSSNSSRDSSSCSDGEWVEAKPTKTCNEEVDHFKTQPFSEQRDEWMSDPLEFRGITRDELRKKEPEEDKNKSLLLQLGQTDREINPYWKDGGSGLPEEKKDLSVPGAAIGDHGLEWLRKALHRAKEQAAEEGRRLEDVVAERWESLAKLESMIKEAESRSEGKFNKHSDYRYCDKKQYKEKQRPYDKMNNFERYKKSCSFKGNESLHSKERNLSEKGFMKPSDTDDNYRSDKKSDNDKYKNKYFNDESYSGKSSKDKIHFKKFSKLSGDTVRNYDYDDKYRTNYKRNKTNDIVKKYSGDHDTGSCNKKMNKHFLKPNDDENSGTSSHSQYRHVKLNASSSSGSGKGWRKDPPSKSVQTNEIVESIISKDDTKNLSKNSVKSVESKTEDIPDFPLNPVFLSADERNEIAAKLIKAEIMGNMDLVKKLKSRLEEARTVAAEVEQTVVLTRTDSKGFTQPLSLPAKPEYGRARKEKIQTHEDGKRIRYFADDDKYSLQEMFEREKRSTVEDQNEMFARLASKNVGLDESARDMDDVFDDMIRVKESSGKAAAKERDKAIEQHRRSSKALDNCHWCLDGKHLLKHLVITIGNKVFLCLPPHESLTEGHCLLIPTQHTLCATQLDEEVWEELQVFKKALVQMFLSMDLDVIFFECAMNFSRMPHMILQCIPLPKESGDVAPIYFKKAILECETEWASNKKLVDLGGKNVRRAIPRGLPYFAVDFGLQPGFAHVIEDEQAFPKNFAQEVIGGMLDVDHRIWRKPKFQKFEEQRQKVVQFSKWWKPFNSIKQEAVTINK